MTNAATQPVFRPFNPEGEMRVYVRNLPHWRQPGATYFVTFRQAGSIPQAVLAQWLDIRARWHRAHDLNPQWKQTNLTRFDSAYAAIPEGVRRAFERQQAKMLHEELDRCHGSCVLQHPESRQEVVKSMSFFHRQRLWLGDYVVMPNHVHAMLIAFDDRKLEDLLGSIKKWTSRHISKWLEKQVEEIRPAGSGRNKSRFWQHESYDRIVRDTQELARFRKYIADNPSKANLRPEQYYYYAADWLDQFAPRPT